MDLVMLNRFETLGLIKFNIYFNFFYLPADADTTMVSFLKQTNGI